VIRGPCPDGPRGRRDRRQTAAPSHTESHRRVRDRRRPLTAARASAEGATPPGTPAPGRQACRDSAPPRRPHRPEGQSTPRWFAARPHRRSRPACQHRNLIRRAAGRCRSGDVRERRVGKARFFFSSQERPKEAVEADLRVTGGPVRLPRERLRSRICSLGRDGWVDGNPGGRGHPGAVVVRLLAPAPATPGPGSHGDQIAHRLRAERRAIRMVRVEVPSDASPEDMLDRRPPPGDREGIEPRQELEVLGPFDVEVEGQVGTRSSGQRLTSLGSPGNHSRGPASIRSLTDV